MRKHRLVFLGTIAAAALSISSSAVAAPVSFSPAPLDPADLSVQNPWSGLYEWSGQELLDLPSPAPDAYTRFTWRDFESAEDQYDFSKLETKLVAAEGKGQKFSFRLRCMTSTGIQAPDYVEALGSWDSGLWSPDWNDAAFLARYRALFDALGKEYDGDPRIGFIEIGNYGKWGEGHSPGPNPATDATKQELVDMVLEAFPNQRHIVMSDDETMLYYALQKSPRIGWRRDSLGWEHFYTTPENKWENDPIKWPLFTERWKTAPIVVEFAPWDDSNPTKARDGFFDRALLGCEKFHVTMVSNGNLAVDASELSTAETEKLSQLHGAIGLRPRLVGVELSDAVAGAPVVLRASWENLGSAPAYEHYEAVYGLREAGSQTALWEFVSDLDLEALFPTSGTPAAVEDPVELPLSLVGEEVELTVRIVDPTAYRGPIHLLNEGREPDGAYPIGTLSITESQAGEDAGAAGSGGAGSAGSAGSGGSPSDADGSAGDTYDASAQNGEGAGSGEDEGCACRAAVRDVHSSTSAVGMVFAVAMALCLRRRRVQPPKGSRFV